jgi:hypothetical protein
MRHRLRVAAGWHGWAVPGTAWPATGRRTHRPCPVLAGPPPAAHTRSLDRRRLAHGAGWPSRDWVRPSMSAGCEGLARHGPRTTGHPETRSPPPTIGGWQGGGARPNSSVSAAGALPCAAPHVYSGRLHEHEVRESFKGRMNVLRTKVRHT